MQLCRGGSIFSADRYTLDGVSGKVSGLVDWLDGTHVAVQATAANQAAAPAANSALNRRLALTLDGNQRYDSNRAASTWNYLHDGTGCTFGSVCVALPDGTNRRVMHGTLDRALNPTSVGVTWYYQASTLSLIVGRNNATRTIASTISATFTNGVAFTSRASYKEGASPEFFFTKTGVTLTSGSSAADPSTADPAYTLRLFANPNTGTEGLQGAWAMSFFAPRYFDAGEDALAKSFIRAWYGEAL